MKIYKREDDGEYKQVARVTAYGDVEGDSSVSKDLQEQLNNEGVFVPGLKDDIEDCYVKEGPNLLVYLENRYSTGYYSASFEEEDHEAMAELSDSSRFSSE